MNSSCILTIVPRGRSSFINQFFESTHDKPSSPIISARFHKSKGDIANEILKLNQFDQLQIIKANLDNILKNYFTQQENHTAVFTFLGSLLACDSDYQILHPSTPLFTLNLRQAIEEHRAFLYKQWLAMVTETHIDDLAGLIHSERQLNKEVVYQIEKTTLKRIKTYFKEIDRALTRKLHDIESALEKDYKDHKKIIESRKKIPDLLLKCKILSYFGGGIISEISSNVGKVIEGIVSNTKMGETLQKCCYKKFNAILKWDNSLEYPMSEHHSDNMQRFIIDFIRELRAEFLESLYSLSTIKFLAKHEKQLLFEEMLHTKQILSGEKFRDTLKKRINERLNQYTYQYTDKIKQFGKTLIQNDNLNFTLPKLAYVYLLGTRMIKAPDNFQDVTDPLLYLQNPDNMEKVLRNMSYGGSHIIELLEESEFFDTSASKTTLNKLGFIRPAKSLFRETASKYLGQESKEESERIEKRKLTILAWYVIPTAFIKHCHTFLPVSLNNPEEKYKAIKEIYDFLNQPIFKKKQPNILLSVLQDIPEINDMLKEKSIINRIQFDYLKLEPKQLKLPALCELLEEPTTLDEIDEIKTSGFHAHQQRIQSYTHETEVHHANMTLHKLSQLIYPTELSSTISDTRLSKQQVDLLLHNDHPFEKGVTYLEAITYGTYDDTLKTKAAIQKQLSEDIHKFILPIQIDKHWMLAVIQLEPYNAMLNITLYDTALFRESEELLEIYLINLLPDDSRNQVTIHLINTHEQKDLLSDEKLMLQNARALMTCDLIIPKKLPKIK